MAHQSNPHAELRSTSNPALSGRTAVNVIRIFGGVGGPPREGRSYPDRDQGALRRVAKDIPKGFVYGLGIGKRLGYIGFE